MNLDLTREVSEKKVLTAVFKIGGSRALRSDGFPGVFYHRLWDVVGPSVLTAVKYFFNTGKFPEVINYIEISSIAKSANPTLPSESEARKEEGMLHKA